MTAWAANTSCVPSDNYPGSPSASCTVDGFRCDAALVSGKDEFGAQCSGNGASVKFDYVP
ncbi:MAG: hypothetical protein ACLP8S_10035 [Solirubrobacteraceae bacterium]